MTPAFIIFTDLDGTLLDHSTYSFKAALPALNLLRQHKIPLILVSSKTREELRYYRRLTGIETHPYVVENGSAICNAANLLGGDKKKQTANDPACMILGKTYTQIKSALEEISAKHHYTIRGFHNATAAEISDRTGLNSSETEKAMKREFSVPLFYDQRAEHILRGEIKNYQLNLLFGGRFMHVLGITDKGEAVKIILKHYREQNPGSAIKSIALGDSRNDEAMLRVVDYPVLVRKKDGSHDPAITMPGLIKSPGIGPQGWNQSVIQLLNKGVGNE
jgi:mannosyl-3-phosphoglycerate phosphatase family protein